MMLTKEELVRAIRSMGLKHDDTVAVHASLRALGPVEGGADALIDALKEVLCDGLFIIPTHTWDRSPRIWPYFDSRLDVPCTGALSRVAAFRKDGVRSLHPSHSVAAFGKGAAAFVAGEQFMRSPCDPRGVTGKFVEAGGKVLLIGVDQRSDTFIHGAEEIMDVPNRLLSHPLTVTVTGPDGKVYVNSDFHRHYRPVSSFYWKFNEPFEALGAVQLYPLGDTMARVCDCRQMLAIMRFIRERADRDVYEDNEPFPAAWWEDYGQENN